MPKSARSSSIAGVCRPKSPRRFGITITPKASCSRSAPARERAYLLHFATRAAQVLRHPEEPLALQQLTELALDHFKMSDTELHEFLVPLSDKIAVFAGVLQVDIGPSNDYESILARAGEELVSLAVSTNLDKERRHRQDAPARSPRRRWKQEAVFDPLTKVFNRRFLESKLRELFERPSDSGTPFGLLFIDLDGFKALNDRFGHAFGDLVLQKVADCLNRQVRQGDIVARFGGDEFCVFSDKIEQQGVEALCQRIWQSINDLTIVSGPQEGRVGASIGATYGCATAGWESPEALLAAADQAMYQAKTQGKNRVVFWQAAGRRLAASRRAGGAPPDFRSLQDFGSLCTPLTVRSVHS